MMDVVLFPKGTIKIRSKRAALTVDPVPAERAKASSDVSLFLQKGVMQSVLPEGVRLSVAGPGEYEIAGVKITVKGEDGHLIYNIRVDGTELLLGRAEAIRGVQEHDMKEYTIVVVRVDGQLNASALTALSPRVVVLYGAKAGEAARQLGKQSSPLAKVQVTTEKLPEEMEVMVLG